MTPKDERPDAWIGEILGQPAAMTRASVALAARPDLLAALAAAGRPGAPIVLTGMGSSAAACAAAATVLGGAGVLATPIETAELLHFQLPALAAAGTLVIFSQSGAGAELVRLLDALGALPARPLQHLARRPLSAHFDHCGTRSWPARWGAMKQAFDADVLVDVRPMNSLAGSDETKVRSLRGRGLGQPPGPGQRHADDAPVGQIGDDLILGHAYLLNARIVAGASHSAHTTPPE